MARIKAQTPLCLLVLMAWLAVSCGRETPVATFRDGGVLTRTDARAINGRTSLESLTRLALGKWLGDQVDPDSLAERERLAVERAENSEIFRLFGARLRGESAVSAEEVQRFIEDHQDDLARPRRVRLWNIFFRASNEVDTREREQVRRRALSVLEQLRQGAEFQQLARDNSDSSTAYRGGKMGATAPGELVPEIEAVAFAMQEGEIRGPIETDDGFTILRCAGFVEGHVLSFEEARQQVRDGLASQAAERAWEELQQTLIEASEFVFFEQEWREGDGGRIVSSIHGDLSRGQVASLLRMGPGGSQTVRRARTTSEQHVLGRAALAHARKLGLLEEPDWSTALASARRSALATVSLDRMARAQWTEPSETQLREAFAAHRGVFRLPDRFRLSVIRVPAGSKPRSQWELAEALRGDIVNGSVDFAAAARSASTHPSAGVGGSLGWRTRRSLASFGPNVFARLVLLEPGDLSEVIEGEESFWLFRMEGFEPARTPRYEEVADEARRAYETEWLRSAHQRAREDVARDLDFRLVDEAFLATPPDPDLER